MALGSRSFAYISQPPPGAALKTDHFRSIFGMAISRATVPVLILRFVPYIEQASQSPVPDGLRFINRPSSMPSLAYQEERSLGPAFAAGETSSRTRAYNNLTSILE